MIAGAELERAIERDRTISKANSSRVCSLTNYWGIPEIEFHDRGGIITGIQHPSGLVIVRDGDDVVYFFDGKGKPKERFAVKDAPSKWTRLSAEAIAVELDRPLCPFPRQ